MTNMFPVYCEHLEAALLLLNKDQTCVAFNVSIREEAVCDCIVQGTMVPLKVITSQV